MLDMDKNADTTNATITREAKAAARNVSLFAIMEEIDAVHGKGMTHSEIANALNAAGNANAIGKQFTRTQVHRIKVAC